MVKDVVHRVGEKLSRPDLIQLGAVETSVTDPHVLLADITRLRQEVDWTPKYDLDHGLDQTISYWRAQLHC